MLDHRHLELALRGRMNVLQSERLTDALLDFLTEQMHIYTMNGESYRLQSLGRSRPSAPEKREEQKLGRQRRHRPADARRGPIRGLLRARHRSCLASLRPTCLILVHR
ncbi:ATP-binding protein [Aurantimonas sp. A2-1-M11]|uniref:ATP-binding protein n=1 Tax=Aurantimonas sp. A2-1-M11 TaxID=3113712 RepID=UPI003FA558AA